MFEFMTVRELYEIVFSGSHVELDSIEYVQLQGWIRTNRCSGKLGFIELNDGTYFRNVQLVYDVDLKNFRGSGQVYDRQRAERDRQVRLHAGWPSAF